MGREGGHLRSAALLLAALWLVYPAKPVRAETPAGPKIFVCRDGSGKVVRTDKLPPGCVEIKQLGTDGSDRGNLEQGLSDGEIAARQECDRRNTEIMAEYRDNIRRDRSLTQKFPNEARHRTAREKALDDVRKSVKLSEDRIGLLLIERKPLLDEAEFYKGKALPPKLKQQLDNNDAALAAQKSLAQNQQDEAVRINSKFDEQLVYLRRLWGGTLLTQPQLTSCGIANARR